MDLDPRINYVAPGDQDRDEFMQRRIALLVDQRTRAEEYAEGCARETAALRQGICDALGLRPQIALPDDVDLLQAIRESATALAWLEENDCGLVPSSVPTGGDDFDVAWEVVEYHLSEPKERVIGSGRTPREAVKAAREDAQKEAE